MSTIFNHMQYELLKTVTSASNALQTAADLRPDILMIGVHLEGQSDGVETAIQINQKLNLPLLFLIRPNDKQYLERIKQTRHDGYLFLPPSESELHFSIELALAHHQMNEMVKEKWTLLSTTLKSIGDAVITTDPHGLITFLNPVAEKLTGWSLQEASGKRLPLVFNIINERTGLKARNPLTRILTKGIITALANHTMLISKNGQRIPIDDSGAPIKDSNGKILGAVLVFRDITERRKAEEALEQERNLLRTVIDNIPDKIYVKDVEGHFITCNQSVAVRMGKTDPDEITGKSDFDLLPHDLATRFHADEQEIIRSGRPLLNHEEPLDQTPGFPRWNLTTKVPLKDKNGEIIGIVGIGRDITARKQAEEALAKERNLLRTLIDNLPDYIYVKDSNGRFMLGNQAVIRQMGLSSLQELIGKSDYDLFPPQIAEKYFNEEQKIIKTGRGLYEHEGPTIDESKPEKQRWVSTSKVPFRDDNGQIAGFVGLGHDITDRRKAEEALHAEMALIYALMQNLPDHIYFKDRASRFLRMSKSQAERFGLDDPAQAIGKTDFDFFTEEHARSAYEDEQRIIQTGQPIIGIEEKETWPDGSETWVSTTKLPLLDNNGNIIGTFGVSRDITDRKKAERDLQKALSDLQNSQDKLNKIINGSSIPQFFIDRDHRIVHWNNALTKLSGRQAEEMIGTRNHWQVFYENERPCLADIIVDAKLEDLPRLYSDKYQKSELIEGAFQATDFFPRLGDTGRWVFLTATAILDSNHNLIGALETIEDITARKQAEEQREKVIRDLQEASNKIKTLRGLIPICACCKKIRDDSGYWNSVESYIHSHADVEFTHGICPDCMKKLYPDYYKKKESSKTD